MSEHIHKIKIEDDYYDQIIAGDKNFEIRFNDRGYNKGDILIFLDEYGIERDEEIKFKIKYVHSGFGMAENFVVLGIERVK